LGTVPVVAARCPTNIQRVHQRRGRRTGEGPRRDGPRPVDDRSARRSIVAGTDGSDGARDAVLFAFEAAQDRRAPLVVVRVWETPLSWHEQIEALDDTSVDWAEQAERDLAEELAGWTADYPDVAVTRRIERARWAAETLVTVAADAGLLVVGARGLGGLRGLDLGETARSVVAHASCPVAVVHRGDLRADDVTEPAVSAVGTPA